MWQPVWWVFSHVGWLWGSEEHIDVSICLPSQFGAAELQLRNLSFIFILLSCYLNFCISIEEPELLGVDGGAFSPFSPFRPGTCTKRRPKKRTKTETKAKIDKQMLWGKSLATNQIKHANSAWMHSVHNGYNMLFVCFFILRTGQKYPSHKKSQDKRHLYLQAFPKKKVFPKNKEKGAVYHKGKWKSGHWLWQQQETVDEAWAGGSD